MKPYLFIFMSKRFYQGKNYITFFMIVLSLTILISCSSTNEKQCAIKDGSKKCKSEVEVYEDSLYKSNKNTYSVPIVVNEIKSNDHAIYEESTYYKTWVAKHFDENKLVIGEHYVYWNLQENEEPIGRRIINNNILHPANTN